MRKRPHSLQVGLQRADIMHLIFFNFRKLPQKRCQTMRFSSSSFPEDLKTFFKILMQITKLLSFRQVFHRFCGYMMKLLIILITESGDNFRAKDESQPSQEVAFNDLPANIVDQCFQRNLQSL